jgi:hypothetical protein
MAQAIAHNLTLLERVRETLRKEAKKAAVLTFLVAVLGILWVRMAMKNGDAPAVATAAMDAPLSDVSQEPTGRSTAAVAFRQWLGNTPSPITRNLFAINLDHFPANGRAVADAGATDSGFWGRLAKSVSARADLTRERQILLDNLQQQAGQLRLESTLMGTTPKAVINGELVREGDFVASGDGKARTQFRVLKIEPRRIVVEREGVRLEVPMK